MASPLKETGIFAAYRRIMERKAAGEGNEGFTLIELLIVIVVLGILAAVVVFALGGITGKSAVAACQADGTTIQTAIAAFDANNPGIAPTGGSLGNLVVAGTTGGPYIQSWPSNFPHYAFQISSSTLQILDTPAGAVPNPPPSTGWVSYAGTTSCAGVQ